MSKESSHVALVVDDHEMVRVLLSSVMRRDLGFGSVLEAASLEEAVQLLGRTRNVALACFDISMPGMKSLKDLQGIRDAFPAVRLAVVTASTDRADVLLALAVGVHAYVPKTLGVGEIVKALRLVMDGQIYIPSLLAQAPAQIRQVDRSTAPPARPVELTQRQREVLRLMAEGKSNKSIARALHLSEGTVKVHVNALFRALGVHNRVSAVRAVGQFGSAGPVG